LTNRLKELYEKIVDNSLYVKDKIINYFIWIYYDGLSWSLIERYKIDDTNKKLMTKLWLILISSMGIIIFATELYFASKDIQIYTRVFIGIFVIILFYLLIYVSVMLGLEKQNSELYVKSCQAIFRYPEQMSKVEHSAIIYIHYEKPKIDEGISDIAALLIEGFRKNKIPYKVYHFFNLGDFEPIFYNNLVTDFWIIGHGDQGGFSYGKKRRKVDYFSYSSLEKRPPKKFIAQLHCNCGRGESLISINNPADGYVTERILMLTQIRYYVITKIRELDQRNLKSTPNSHS